MLNIARKIGLGLLQMAIVSFVVFLLLSASPGDPARDMAGEFATEEQVDQIRDDLGLNRPVLVQYADWLSHAIRGDLGESATTGENVTTILARTIPTSMSIVGAALIVAVTFAFIGGIVAALNLGGLLDRFVLFITSVGVAIPSFWLALILISTFSIKYQLLPAVGYVPFSEGWWEWLRHLILPAISLAGVTMAEVTRQLRGSLADAMGTDYVLAARAKGMPRRRLVFKHGLKNALIPVLTLLGVRVSQLVAGAVIVESIFNIKGLGSQVVDAALGRDIPVVLGITVFTAFVVLMTSIVLDFIHPYLNPKMRRH